MDMAFKCHPTNPISSNKEPQEATLKDHFPRKVSWGLVLAKLTRIWSDSRGLHSPAAPPQNLEGTGLDGDHRAGLHQVILS